MSIIKFLNDQNSGDKSLFWGRAERDGLPFRAHKHPMLSEREFEELSETVHDAHVQWWNLANPEDQAAYAQVVDKHLNGGYYTIWHAEYHYSSPECMMALVIYSQNVKEVPDRYLQGPMTNG